MSDNYFEPGTESAFADLPDESADPTMMESAFADLPDESSSTWQGPGTTEGTTPVDRLVNEVQNGTDDSVQIPFDNNAQTNLALAIGARHNLQDYPLTIDGLAEHMPIELPRVWPTEVDLLGTDVQLTPHETAETTLVPRTSEFELGTTPEAESDPATVDDPGFEGGTPNVMSDLLRDRVIDLVDQHAHEGEITLDELQAAFEDAGIVTTTDGSEPTLNGLIDRDGHPTTAILSTPDEGVGLYRLAHGNGVIELESLRTGAIYGADPGAVSQVWRDSGARVIAPPVPDVTEGSESTASAGDGSDDQLRNVLVAGAVLLPMAGGAAYITTRKLR